MRIRFEQAIDAQAATNPAGLANSLITWQRQIIEEGGGTNDVKADPACRLLVYQLAYLFKVDNLSSAEYSQLHAECVNRSSN